MRKTKEGSTWHNTVRYRIRTQLQEEREELEIAVELEKLRYQQELVKLLETGDMKEFYRLAN